MFQTADRKTLLNAMMLSYAVDIPQLRSKSVVIAPADSTSAAGTHRLFTVLIWFYGLSEQKPVDVLGSRTPTVLRLSGSFNSVFCAAP